MSQDISIQTQCGQKSWQNFSWKSFDKGLSARSTQTAHNIDSEQLKAQNASFINGKW